MGNPFLSPSFSLASPPCPFYPLFPSIPLLSDSSHSEKQTFLNPAKRSGERCELPQRGLGQNPSRNRIRYILYLKYDICYLSNVVQFKQYQGKHLRLTFKFRWVNYTDWKQEVGERSAPAFLRTLTPTNDGYHNDNDKIVFSVRRTRAGPTSLPSFVNKPICYSVNTVSAAGCSKMSLHC